MYGWDGRLKMRVLMTVSCVWTSRLVGDRGRLPWGVPLGMIRESVSGIVY